MTLKTSLTLPPRDKVTGRFIRRSLSKIPLTDIIRKWEEPVHRLVAFGWSIPSFDDNRILTVGDYFSELVGRKTVQSLEDECVIVRSGRNGELLHSVDLGVTYDPKTYRNMQSLIGILWFYRCLITNPKLMPRISR